MGLGTCGLCGIRCCLFLTEQGNNLWQALLDASCFPYLLKNLHLTQGIHIYHFALNMSSLRPAVSHAVRDKKQSGEALVRPRLWGKEPGA